MGVDTTVTEHVLADGYWATGVNEEHQLVGQSEEGYAVYWSSDFHQPTGGHASPH